jgi:four helix bundle protein
VSFPSLKYCLNKEAGSRRQEAGDREKMKGCSHILAPSIHYSFKEAFHSVSKTYFFIKTKCMAIGKFEDIIGWQKAQDYAVDIYVTFGQLRDFSFKDQICRASISISSNIAEGFDRQSNKEFVRFLYIALGSCGETKSLVYLAHRLNYCNEEDQLSFLDKANEICRIIHGLINSMEK